MVVAFFSCVFAIVAHVHVVAADICLATVVVGFGLARAVVGSVLAGLGLALVMGESVGALGLAVFGSVAVVVAWLWLEVRFWMVVAVVRVASGTVGSGFAVSFGRAVGMDERDAEMKSVMG